MAKKKKSNKLSRKTLMKLPKSKTAEVMLLPKPVETISADGGSLNFYACSNPVFKRNYVAIEMARGTICDEAFVEPTELIFLDPAAMRQMAKFLNQAADWKEACP